MEKQKLVQDMKSAVNGSFITRQKLAAYMGVKDGHNVDKYLKGLDRVSNKYYFIPDVVERLLERRN